MHLSANPHFYDYIHSITLNDGQADFCDGGGQCMHYGLTGTYNLTANKDNTGTLTFTINDNTFTVEYIIEKGPFAIDENYITTDVDGTFTTYLHRYVFNIDPHALLWESNVDKTVGLFKMLNPVINGENVYYDRNTKQDLDLKQIKAAGGKFIEPLLMRITHNTKGPINEYAKAVTGRDHDLSIPNSRGMKSGFIIFSKSEMTPKAFIYFQNSDFENCYVKDFGSKSEKYTELIVNIFTSSFSGTNLVFDKGLKDLEKRIQEELQN